MSKAPTQTHFSMFKPFDNSRGYTRCIVSVEHVQEFESMGFYASPHLFPKGESDARPNEKQVQDHEGHERQEDDGQENDGPQNDEKTQEIDGLYVSDGDKGDGCRPDSKEWHKRVVSQMECKEEIADYIEKLTGTTLNTRRHHHNFVTDALTQIDAHFIKVAAHARHSSESD